MKLTGFDTATGISVSGASGNPQISLDGGATWVTSGTIQPSGSFEVGLTTPNTQATATTATVTAGGVSANWVVTTENMTPSAFSIPAVNNADPSVLVSSPAVELTGFDTATAISVSGQGSPQISLDGTSWVTSGTIQPNTSFTVRLTSSSSYSTAMTATVTAGGVAGNFIVTTVATPASISYSASLNSLVAGTPVSVSPTVAGMTSPVSYSLVGTNQLPTGMSLAGSGGISGTPTTAGTFTYTIQATDKNSVTATASITSVVAGTIAYALPSSLSTLQSYASLAPTSYGISNISSFAVSGGALPNGMGIDRASGIISGTPTAAGSYAFVVEGSNASQTAYSASYSWTVVSTAVAAITYPTLANTLTYGASVSASPGLAGLSAPVSYSVVSGSLPSGLSLGSNGAISGSPSAVGVFLPYTIQAVDANNAKATVSISQTVNGTLAYSLPTMLPVGQAYISSAPQGYPTTAGSYTFTITAKDANNVTASATITELVNGTLAYALPSTLSTAQTYAFPAPTAYGISGITSYSISSGALPNGMKLNAVTEGSPAAPPPQACPASP